MRFLSTAGLNEDLTAVKRWLQNWRDNTNQSTHTRNFKGCQLSSAIIKRKRRDIMDALALFIAHQLGILWTRNKEELYCKQENC